MRVPMLVRMRIERKRPPRVSTRGPFDLKPGDDLLSHGMTPHYHRRRDVFTSEFGMGSGGSRPLLPPGKPCMRLVIAMQ